MAAPMAPTPKDVDRITDEENTTVLHSDKNKPGRRQSYQRPSHFVEYGQDMDPATILHNPHFNKGTAFTMHERNKLGLRGLLPHCVESIEVQVKRCYLQFQRFTIPMSKYIYLSTLRDRNDTLFYHLIIQNMEECLPYIYTPTVGQACKEFGLQFRQAEGMYISKDDTGFIRQILNNWKSNTTSDVAIIVVTDGSRILGLGDLGACGMGIPVGKLSLYVAGGGFHPAATLPVVLDVGTNNEALMKDEFYLGQRHKRLGDTEYYGLVDEFLMAVKDKWPHALIQFEDFSNNHCFNILEKYRSKICCFNDDIQGTGVTIAAGFLNALKITGCNTKQALTNSRVIFYGAGAAGTGVADQIRQALVKRYGLSDEDTFKMFYLVDSKGIVATCRKDYAELQGFKKPYARKDMDRDYSDLLEIVDYVKPVALIGLSGQPGKFSKEVISRMADLTKRPIVFPLSNPTSQSECTFQQAIEWTNGQVVFASGSPFDSVEFQGKTYECSQGNNLYAFPGIGFGAWLSRCTSVSNGMLDAATNALADSVSEEYLKNGRLYPHLQQCRDVSALIASSVIQQAHKEGLTRYTPVSYDDPAEILAFVKRSMYSPLYLEWQK